MKTLSESGAPVGAGKRKRSLGLALLLVTVFAGAFGVRWLHDQRSKAMVEEDADGAAQLALADKIKHLPSADRLPALLKALQDSDSNVRAAAMDPLVDLHTREATDAVEAAFRDSASTVRQAAVENLPKLDKERGLRLELAALSDDDLWLREFVVSRFASDLRHSNLDNRALPTLIHALDDSSPEVQTLTMTVLRHLTGKDWRVSGTASPTERKVVVGRWKQWWSQSSQRANIPVEFQTVPARPSTRTDPAPDFHLNDTTGNSVRLSTERGKPVLLNFWGTWCPPCQKEIPDLIRLDADYRSKGLNVIGVALSEKNGVDGLREWCANHAISYRQAIATEEILNAYGNIHEVPVTVLIDAQGRIRNRWEGDRDYNTFRAAVDRAMKQ